MKVGLFCRPHQLPGGRADLFLVAARLAEEAGLHSIHLGEHLIMGAHPDRYPYGEFAHAQRTPWFEPLIMLGAAAAATTRLRLSTGVLLSPLRSPILLAKSIATLDVLSNGRTELGLGTGWQREEYEASGLDWNLRYALFDNGIRACRALWGAQPASFHSSTVTFSEVTALPTPVQQRVPLLLGMAATPRNAQRIAEYADGWCPVRPPVEVLRRGVDEITRAFDAVGRDPAELVIRVQAPLATHDNGTIDVQRTLACTPEFSAAGATVLSVGPTTGCDSVAELEDLIGSLGDTGRTYDEIEVGI